MALRLREVSLSHEYSTIRRHHGVRGEQSALARAWPRGSACGPTTRGLVLTCSTQDFVSSASARACVYLCVYSKRGFFFANISLSKHAILTECAEFQSTTRVWKLSKSAICRMLILHTYQHLVIIIRSIHASLKVEIKLREI